MKAGLSLAYCRYCDFLNIMTYDLHGAWEPVTGHNSPLYARRWETGNDRTLNVVSIPMTDITICLVGNMRTNETRSIDTSSRWSILETHLVDGLFWNISKFARYRPKETIVLITILFGFF